MSSSLAITKPSDGETLQSLQAPSSQDTPRRKGVGVLGPRGVPANPDDDMLNPNPSSNPGSSLAGPVRPSQTFNVSIRGCVKVALCTTLTLPIALQPSVHWTIFAIISAVGFSAPTSKLHGPLRFGYLRYGPQLHHVYNLLSPWLLYVWGPLYFSPAIKYIYPPHSVVSHVLSLLVPTISLSVVGISATSYIHTYRAYIAEVAEVSTLCALAVSDATAAASHSQSLVRSVMGYEKQLLRIVGVTRRDAALAQSVHETDFFDCAATAWTTLGRVTAPAGEGARIVEEAIALKNEDMSDDEDSYDVPQTRDDVVQTIMKQLNTAQAVVETSEAAKRQHAKGRKNILSNAAEAAEAARKLREVIVGLEKWLYDVVIGVERVKGLAESAKVVAAEGEISKAKKLISTARVNMEKVQEGKKMLTDAEETAREILFKLLLMEPTGPTEETSETLVTL